MMSSDTIHIVVSKDGEDYKLGKVEKLLSKQQVIIHHSISTKISTNKNSTYFLICQKLRLVSCNFMLKKSKIFKFSISKFKSIGFIKNKFFSILIRF